MTYCKRVGPISSSPLSRHRAFQGTEQLVAAALDEIKAEQFFDSLKASPRTNGKQGENWELISAQLLDNLVPRVRSLSHLLLGHPLSRYLHGQLIKKITQAAQIMSQHHKLQDPFLCQNHLDQLRCEFTSEKFLEGLLTQVIDANFYDLLINSWDGLMEIRFEGDLDFFNHLQPMQSLDIADVIEELLLNASRHGQASAVRVRIEQLNKQEISIFVSDNGVGLKKNTQPGLGTHLFDSASNNRWGLSEGPDGGCMAQLKITIL